MTIITTTTPLHGWSIDQMNKENAETTYQNYSLERYLIESQGYDDYDAWVRVLQEPEVVKKEWEEDTRIWEQ